MYQAPHPTWRVLWARADRLLGTTVDGRRIVERASGLDGADLVRHLDDPVPERAIPFVEGMVERRMAGEPLQYVVGRWGFRWLKPALVSASGRSHTRVHTSRDTGPADLTVEEGHTMERIFACRVDELEPGSSMTIEGATAIAVYRTEATLKEALNDVRLLKERYSRVSIQDKGQRYNTDLLEAVELGFLLELAEVLVVGALVRQESRGGHAREDYPNRDDANWMRHTMAYKQGNELTADIRLDYKPVVQTRYQPMERKY